MESSVAPTAASEEFADEVMDGWVVSEVMVMLTDVLPNSGAPPEAVLGP